MNEAAPVADDHAPLLERELHVCQLLVLHLEKVVRVVVPSRASSRRTSPAQSPPKVAQGGLPTLVTKQLHATLDT